MVYAGLRYLADADAAAMAAETQARCLQMLERSTAVGTAARSSILAAFTAGQGYCADADYSPRAWLISKTRITKGAAAAYTAWARRAAAHPEVAAVLAAGEMTESYARTICQWTDKLPQDCRADADEILLAAAQAGMDLRDLAGLAAEIYARSRPEDPGGKDGQFEDRSVKLETTFQGAGVLAGDLTPECAAVVRAVLDALAAPAGAEDTRSQAQRCHDGLHEAMQRLVTAGLLPERAGQPVKALVHLSLADLMLLEGSSALQQEWTSRVRGQWAARRAEASAGAGDGGAWLDGDAADAVACDAAMTPIVTGDVNPGALEDLVRLCVQLDRLRHRPSDDRPGDRADGDPEGAGHDDTAASATTSRRRRRRSRRQRRNAATRPGLRHRAGLGSARTRDHRQGRRTWSRVRAGWRRSCAAGSSAPGWAAPASRWTSATPSRSRPGSAPPLSSGTSSAGGPEAAASPPAPARSTTSGTRRTAARPAPRTACCCVSTTTRSASTAGDGP